MNFKVKTTKKKTSAAGDSQSPQMPIGLILKDHRKVLSTEFGILDIDFVHDRLNYFKHIPKNGKELIARALGYQKGLRQVLDCTLGLGFDAVLMARLGFSVTAVERSQIIFPLLEQALAEAQFEASTKDWASRLKFIQTDALDYLRGLDPKPQVIYLDPMFPEASKSSLPRKEMQIFRSLFGSEEPGESQELLRAALSVASDRVVVKRPLKAPELDKGVIHRFEGKSMRYDLYSGKA